MNDKKVGESGIIALGLFLMSAILFLLGEDWRTTLIASGLFAIAGEINSYREDMK